MAHKVADANYSALAEFRYRIRLFLEASEIASRSVGLEPEQYQLLLTVRGMPRGSAATIRALAEQLRVRHNTVVERVDRLAHMKLVHRTHSSEDRRVVLVHASPRGDRILERLARKRLSELRRTGPALIAALSKVISATRHKRSKR